MEFAWNWQLPVVAYIQASHQQSLQLGPFPDFFEEIGRDLVRIVCEKSVFLLMLLWLVNPAALMANKLVKNMILVYIQGEILIWG